MLSVRTADRSQCICKITPGGSLFTHSALSLRRDISFWVMCLYFVCCTLRYLWTSLIIPSTSISDDSLMCDVYRWVRCEVVQEFLWKLELYYNIIITSEMFWCSKYMVCRFSLLQIIFLFLWKQKPLWTEKASSTNSQTLWQSYNIIITLSSGSHWQNQAHFVHRLQILMPLCSTFAHWKWV